MKVCFTGRRALGGVKMRGVQIAKALGIPFLDLKAEFLQSGEHWDTVILVKYHDGLGAEIRNRTDRLIYDPLDCWSSLREWGKRSPVDFWRWTRRELGYDDILATSVACGKTMATACPTVRVYLLPHHHDSGVGPKWYDPAGPIVYAGGIRFLGDQVDAMKRGAGQIGRQLVIDFDRECQRSLRGASLAISVRLPPESTELNRNCKPTVKAMNAAAAGLPLLASCDPAHATMHPDACWYRPLESWADNFCRALQFPPVRGAITAQDSAARLRRILDSSAGVWRA